MFCCKLAFKSNLLVCFLTLNHCEPIVSCMAKRYDRLHPSLTFLSSKSTSAWFFVAFLNSFFRTCCFFELCFFELVAFSNLLLFRTCCFFEHRNRQHLEAHSSCLWIYIHGILLVCSLCMQCCQKLEFYPKVWAYIFIYLFPIASRSCQHCYWFTTGLFVPCTVMPNTWILSQ